MSEKLELRQLEGGLTKRQKEVARALAIELTAKAIQEESVTDVGAHSYEDIFKLTQTESFVKWQEETLNTPTKHGHPVEKVAHLLVTLNQSELVLAAVSGYIDFIRRQLDVASDNVKYVMNAVFQAYDGEITGLKIKDKEGKEWQVYTASSTPDSVVLRRKKGKHKRPSKKSRTTSASRKRSTR